MLFYRYIKKFFLARRHFGFILFIIALMMVVSIHGIVFEITNLVFQYIYSKILKLKFVGIRSGIFIFPLQLGSVLCIQIF